MDGVGSTTADDRSPVLVAAAWILGVVILAMAAGTVILHIANRGIPVGPDAQDWARLAVLPVLITPAALLILTHRPRHVVGWLLLTTAFMFALSGFGQQYGVWAIETHPGARGGALGLWLSGRFAAFLDLTLFLALMLFPSGRTVSPRWRWWLWFGISVNIAIVLIGFVHPLPLAPDAPGRVGQLQNPLALPGSESSWNVVLGITVALSVIALLGGGLSVIIRYRRSVGEERAQLRWAAWALVPLLVASTMGSVLSPGVALVLDAVATTLFVVALAVAILRYRLYDIDFVINRTLVYLLLSGCIVAAYVGVVAALGAIFQAKASVVISLVATGLVAAAFSPLRMRLQRSVDRLMYGERDQPYEVLARLGNRLAAATVAEEVLPSVAQTVAEAMRVPYVAVEMASEDGLSTIVAHGRPVDHALRLPLVHHGAQVGDLVVGPRGPNESFSAADRQLLDDLARQAAVAVHAVALTTDLRRSRERIVTAREEERRRLRRDLHDGLGPTLAAIAVRAEAARRALQHDPDRASEALSSIASDAQSAVIEVRRIVQDLRPPALDELGLVGAIRARADHFGEHLIVDVAAPERLDDLPAAVESVAYRIVSEALTNVVRHSSATHAWVDIEEQPHSLVIEVADDGTGVSAGDPVGVGLASMHERAAELGGTCNIAVRTEGGTLVRVVLPVHRSEQRAEQSA